VTQVIETVRAAGEERFFSPAALPAPRPVVEVLDRMQQAVEASVGDITLRALAAQGSEPAKRDRMVPQDT